MKERDDWHLTEAVIHEYGRGDPFAAAIRATRMPMVITDPRLPDNPIIFVNEAFQRLTGYSRDEIMGHNCRFLQGPETSREAVAEVRRAIAEGIDIQIDILNYRKDGSTFWNALYLSPTRNAKGEIQFFFASQLDVTERVEAQRRVAAQKAFVEAEVERRTAELKEALEAKTLLLHEVDHRVKNNLGMIGSLLRLQARTISDFEIRSKLETMLERVDALAAVHRRLYQSEDVTRFDIASFTKGLVHDIIVVSGRTDIEVEMAFGPLEIPSGHADVFGLIINEVVTNAVKHGFAGGRSGTLHVNGSASDGTVTLSIIDDGLGMGKQDLQKCGFGKTLVLRLAKQIHAKITWEDADPGTKVEIIFPVAA